MDARRSAFAAADAEASHGKLDLVPLQIAHFGRPLDKTFGVSGGGLVGDRVDNAEHVLGAMIDLAHEEVLPFLTLLAFGNILDHGRVAQWLAGLIANDVGRDPRPNRVSVFTDVALFYVENGQLSCNHASKQLAGAVAVVRMRDVEYRPREQIRLAVGHELAHCGVGAEEAAGFGVDLDLAYAADLEHGTECPLALTKQILRRLPPGGRPSKLRH